MDPRLLIVCEHASSKYGGEAMLPLNYFILMSKRLPMVCLLTHERVKKDIESLDGVDPEKIYYIPDTAMHKWLHKLGKRLPDRISLVTTGALMHFITQLYQWVLARKIIREMNISVVHEPAPVSPRQPSIMFGLGVPVVIGPMNGGMQFPPAFTYMTSSAERVLYTVMRMFTALYNVLIPGKLFARFLLAANERTARSLPPLRLGKVVDLVENGVFSSTIVDGHECSNGSDFVNVVYVGKLIDLKAVDVAIDAVAACDNQSIRFTIVGDGPERKALEARASMAVSDRIVFVGAVPHSSVKDYYDQADIFILPSVRECGGAVVLEAMARGLPVVATNWGGPADYVTPETGILIDPLSREHLVTEFAKAIDILAISPELREQYGRAAVKRVREHFTWEGKVEKMIEIYNTAIEG